MNPGWYGPIGAAVVALIGFALQWWTKRVDREAARTDIADKVAEVWERTSGRLDKDLETLGKKCDQCLVELNLAVKAAKVAVERAEAAEVRANAAEARAVAAERRADRTDRTNAALIDAWTEAIPLLAADAEATKFLRATIRAARQARYEG